MSLNRILGLFALLFSANFSAFTQDFEVSPVVVNFNVEPREIGTQSVMLTNHSNKRETYTIEIYDLAYDDEGVPMSNLEAGTTKNSLANWITISPSFIELNPNETRSIDLTLTVPSEGKETSWAIMYIKTSEERKSVYADKQMATGVLISPRIRVIIINSPRSNNKFSAKFLALSEGKPNDEGQRVFKAKVSNDGGRVVNPKIFIMAANIKTGKEYKQNHINFTLMPTETKTIELPLTLDLPSGEYALAVIMDYGHGSNLEVTQLMITVP